MSIDEIKKVLVDKGGYSEFSAGMTANRIISMDKEALDAFALWCQTGEIQNLCCKDYSVEKLTGEYGLKIPAAFLTISDLKADYDNVAMILESGNK